MVFAAVIAFADNTCADLCTSCAASASNESCGKVYDICNCPAVLDSVNKARKAHQDEILNRQRVLLQEFDASCEKKFCTRTFFFKDEVYYALEVSTGLTSKEELVKFDKTSTDKVEKPAKLSDDCKELCRNVEVDTTTFYREDYTPAYSDPIQEKIDKSCGCYAFRKQKKLYMDAQKRDSVYRFEESLHKVENAKVLVDTLQHTCNGKEACSVQVTLQKSNYKIVKMKPFKIKPSSLPKRKKKKERMK